MKLIGRKLVTDFGDVTVGIEIIPKAVSPYPVRERHSLLYDIFDFLGERVEKLVGFPADEPWGRSLNEMMPRHAEWAWKTQQEIESEPPV